HPVGHGAEQPPRVLVVAQLTPGLARAEQLFPQLQGRASPEQEGAGIVGSGYGDDPNLVTVDDVGAHDAETGEIDNRAGDLAQDSVDVPARVDVVRDHL